MAEQTGKCIGVVDGAMMIMEDGQTVTLAGVKVPRLGIPGGSAMRTVLQRHVQDKEFSFEVQGRDHMGYASITATVEAGNLAEVMNQALKDYGYAA